MKDDDLIEKWLTSTPSDAPAGVVRRVLVRVFGKQALRRNAGRSQVEKRLDYYLSLDYPVEIRRIDDSLGGGYVATIPSLGSQAFVGDGETPQEAYENLLAAKKEIFAQYLEQGMAIPEPVAESEYEDYSGKLVVRMPRELHARLAAAAKQNHTSLNQFIVYGLSSFEAKWDVVQEVKGMVSTARAAATTAWCTGRPWEVANQHAKPEVRIIN